MPKTTFRVVTRGPDGGLRVRDYPDTDYLARHHTQTGIDDCSTDLELRGMPVFKGLVGPMPDGKTVARYESPEVFETLTKEWVLAKAARRTRRRPGSPAAPASETNVAVMDAPVTLEPETPLPAPTEPLVDSSPSVVAEEQRSESDTPAESVFTQAVGWLRRSFKSR
ncbi:MAG: hypothetical protein ACKOBW_00230 [Planctomycetota bacterium]